MTSTPSTAQAVRTDLADRLLTEAFVIVRTSLSVGPGSRQLSWDALDLNAEQRRTLEGAMGAKPPRVHPFEEMHKAGVKVKSALESFQRRWTVQSGVFRLYAQKDEEQVAEALFAIRRLADEQRAEIQALADAARFRWYQQVQDLLQQAGIDDPIIKSRLQSYFPSDERLARCLQVTWNVRVIHSLEDQAEQSVRLRQVRQDMQELTARERLHYESEQAVRAATQEVADHAASELWSVLTEALESLDAASKRELMNGKRRQSLVDTTRRIETLAGMFQGSDGLMDLASDIRGLVTATDTRANSAEFKERVQSLLDRAAPELKNLTDPSKQGHRSVARFIQ